MLRNRTPIHTLTTGLTIAGALVFATAIPAASPAFPSSIPFVRLPSTQAKELVAGTRVPSGARDAMPFEALPRGAARIVIESTAPSETRAAVEAAGGRVERTWRNLVQATVPRAAVPGLERRPSVGRVRAPMRMSLDAVGGEEVDASLAAAWLAKGFSGKGVKVAIIDGGFAGLADRQAAGDLPPNVVTQDFCGGRFATADVHGTAVAEIVHEMAPDAQLYLLCIDTEVDLAAAVGYAAAQGVQVINHSASWFGPVRGDGSGIFGSIVSAARAAGIIWVNSAGNEADTHWSGTFSSADGDRWHDFAPGDEGNTSWWPNGEAICGFLRWDEWNGGASDFDLVLYDSTTGEELAVSEDEQSGSEPPVEGLCTDERRGGNLRVAWGIYGYDVRSTPRMDLFVFAPPLEYQTAAGSLLEPATSPAALAVGALCWQSRQPEFYSSQGPTIDGRTKPDIAGHDSVSSATYGGSTACPWTGFAGTSASAPEVAGAAALVKQAFPSYGPDQLQQYLQKAARDVGTPGPDNVTGAGELQLPTPPDQVKPTAKALASSGKAGKRVKLLFAAADDSGKVDVVVQVKRNGRVVATLRRNDLRAASLKQFWVAWPAPGKPTGSYQHCVTASDAAGNKSPMSCARVTLR